MRFEYKLLIGGGIFVLLTMVIAGVVVFNIFSEPSTPNQQGLSGTLVQLEDNPMQGAPCHQMGGQYMGDCPVREIALEAYRYDWSEPTITVKSGEIVRIVATSKDVTHGLAIPQINFNMQIQPGQTTTGEFQAPAPGEYAFGCSVMCGSGHNNMQGKLVVK
jgi:heme/copper-type cytochrome/quinol oxidase subunit 2